MNRSRIILIVLALVIVISLITSIAVAGGNDRKFNKSADRMEIEQLTTTYAWSIDDKNLDALMSIFVEGEPGVDEIYPIYDISALQIPGLERVEGTTAIRAFMQNAVIPGEPWAFSSISNVDIMFTGNKTATGGDYYIHDGFVPYGEYNTTDPVTGEPITKVGMYSQFNPDTYSLLCEPDTLVRAYKEGQHLYDFVKVKDGWKIHVMISSPTFSAPDEIISVNNISPAKKPWHPMFDAMAICE